MIEKFEVKDFKCHEGLNTFYFPGITIISGANNSGKTSLMQSVYILTQNTNMDMPVLLLNSDMKLGTFSDILNKDKGNRDTIEFGVSFEKSLLESYGIEELSVNYIYKNPSCLKRWNYNYGYPVLFGMDIEYKEAGCSTQFSVIRLDEDIEAGPYYSIKGDIENGYLRIIGIKPENIIYDEVHLDNRRLCSKQFECICKFIELIDKKNFKYLRAFRVDNFDGAAAECFGSVGIHGENTAEIISQMWDMDIDFKYEDNKSMRFSDLFDVWIKRMLGNQYRIRSRRLDKSKYKVVVDEPEYGMEYEINQVGFGICQVLPILTMVLYSKRHDVLLIENPEIHLHPKLQAEIADLLIFALKNDRKIIVETHSEHIINRMRLRIKEDKSLKKRINIYFFEKHEDASGYQEIEVDYDGRINYWPEEFFDQSYYDTLGLIKK